ncbi:MAG: glycosyltransferase family 87 protein [Dehalococcoidia bacterium]
MTDVLEIEGPPKRAAGWALALIGVALIVHALMMGSLFWGYLDPLFDNSNVHEQGVDFFSIYEAGHRALEGGSVYFTDPDISPVVPYSSLYRYVPGFAYVFALPPNALHIGAWTAYWSWVTLYELLLILNAYATWRLGGRTTWAAIGAAMWFVFSPFYLEQYMGQFSFLMATLLLWTGAGAVHGRELLAGPPWVVSLVIKSSSALLAPLFLRLRWWRSLIAGAVLGGLSLVYFLWRPDDWEIFWVANTGVLGESTVRATYFNPGDLGAVSLLRNSILAFDADAQSVSTVYLEALAYTVIGVSLVATFWPRRIDPLAVFAMWVASFFLVYTVWEHHYVMLLPALVLLVIFRPSLRPLALVAFFFIAVPTPYWLMENVWNTGPISTLNQYQSHQEMWPAWGVITQHAIKVVPVALLWGWLAGSQLRNGVWLPRSSLLRLRRGTRPATIELG